MNQAVTLDDVVRMCADARMSQEGRFSYRDYTVVLAYGFSIQPEVTFQKFGVMPGEHPFGAWGTFFGIVEDDGRLITGGCPIWDAAANSDLSLEERKKKRLAFASHEAKSIIDAMVQVRKERLH